MQDIRDIGVRVTTDALDHVDADALVINWFKEEKGHLPAEWASLDKALNGVLRAVLEGDDLKGSLYETEPIHTTGRIKPRRVLLICAGKRDTFDVLRLRNLAAAATRALRDRGVKRIAFALRAPNTGPARIAQAIVDGALTGPIEPDLYRTQDKETRKIGEVILVAADKKDRAELEAGVARGQSIAAGIAFTRSLAEEPANIMTPLEVAARTQQMAKEAGLQCDVLDEDALRAQGMLSLLSVAQGSQHPARVVVLTYKGGGETLGLVGKGVTFDTGGISIKPAENMHHMKYDMSGAAAVIGAMLAIAHLKPKMNVIGVVGLVENMPGSKATKPGDVVRAANGKTIEILNTDAEGRLVLADALDLARRRGATHLVDAATLTGGIVIALGHVAMGVFGEPQGWVDQVLAAAAAGGERGWQMPLFPEYKELILTPIADLANTGGRAASSITAAMFLKEFVADTPWVHLDIAGTAYLERETPYNSKGANGAAVRTFVELASPSPE